jgi:RNA polymerase sigma factor (sigma-70 family)
MLKEVSLMDSSRQLAQYLVSISQTPFLTAGQERKLVLRYRAGDEKAGEELVVSNLRFVVAVAKEYGSSGLPLMDLIQEGNVGLMRAVVKFDPRRKLRLCTYAIWWIHALIRRYVKSRRSMVSSKNHAGRDISLDTPVYADTESEETLLDLLTDGVRVDDECIENESAKIARERVLRALSKLKPNERYVIRMHKLNERKTTLDDIGQSLGVSRERVRQIELKAMKKFKNILERDGMSG